ncbi:MAG: hypothetical protein ACRDTC_20895 [Pseudonocardiaceae bacterium]
MFGWLMVVASRYQCGGCDPEVILMLSSGSSDALVERLLTRVRELESIVARQHQVIA